MYFLMFLIPLVAWIVIAKIFFRVSFSIGEMAIQFGVTVLIMALVYFIGNSSQTSDSMFINGEIYKLEPRKESCPIGWTDYSDSHCTEYTTRQKYTHSTTSCSGSGTSRTCTTTRHYKTQYNYDYSWERRYFVFANYDPYDSTRYEIRRVDRQGVNVPPKFAELEIGDPTTRQIHFNNYIRGASDSLFSEIPPREDDVVLAYPSVRNLFKSNRVIISEVSFNSDEWKEWNEEVMQLNTNIRKTGANVIIAVTGDSKVFSEMLARAWEAHNINDVVVSIGIDENKNISWVDVASWSANSLVNVDINNDILNLKTLDTDKINDIIETAVINHFELRSMEEFEYLAEEIRPPMWVNVVMLIILLIITPGMTYIFHRNDFV